MPDFDYMGVTGDGRFLRGMISAESKRDLAQKLRELGLFMAWWKEKKKLPDIVQPQLQPEPDHEERGEEAPIGLRRGRFSLGLLDWMINHSGGAIQTKKQAMGILVMTAAILTGTILNARYSLRPKYPKPLTDFRSPKRLVF